MKKDLKARAHSLSPVIITGNLGLTPALHQELEVALTAHELIKIRVNAATRDDREAMIQEIITTHQAELVQHVGHVIAIYRQSDTNAR